MILTSTDYCGECTTNGRACQMGWDSAGWGCRRSGGMRRLDGAIERSGNQGAVVNKEDKRSPNSRWVWSMPHTGKYYLMAELRGVEQVATLLLFYSSTLYDTHSDWGVIADRRVEESKSLRAW